MTFIQKWNHISKTGVGINRSKIGHISISSFCFDDLHLSVQFDLIRSNYFISKLYMSVLELDWIRKNQLNCICLKIL